MKGVLGWEENCYQAALQPPSQQSKKKKNPFAVRAAHLSLFLTLWHTALSLPPLSLSQSPFLSLSIQQRTQMQGG